MSSIRFKLIKKKLNFKIDFRRASLLAITQRTSDEFKIAKRFFYAEILSLTKKNSFIKRRPAPKELMPIKWIWTSY